MVVSFLESLAMVLTAVFSGMMVSFSLAMVSKLAMVGCSILGMVVTFLLKFSNSFRSRSDMVAWNIGVSPR